MLKSIKFGEFYKKKLITIIYFYYFLNDKKQKNYYFFFLILEDTNQIIRRSSRKIVQIESNFYEKGLDHIKYKMNKKLMIVYIMI